MSEKPKKTEGFRFEKNPKAPDWILSTLSLDVDTFSKWADQNKNHKGWVNFDLKQTKDGRLYFEFNDFGNKPKSPNEDTVPF